MARPMPAGMSAKKTLLIEKLTVSLREDMKYSDFFDNPKEELAVKNIFTESREKLDYAKSVFNENAAMACSWL